MENWTLSDNITMINNIEEKFPVHQWKIKGIDVWPIVRQEINTTLSFSFLSANKPEKSTRSFLKSTIVGNLKYISASIKDFRNNDRFTRKANILFLGDGVSYTWMSNEWYERFCDPFISTFSKHQYTTLRWDTYHHHFTPRYSPSVFIQPWVDMIAAKVTLFQNGNFSNLPGYDEVVKYYEPYARYAPFPSLKRINYKANIIRSLADFFKKKLLKVNPMAAFVVWYYGTYASAYVLACRELNIPVIDIQHGVQGSLHAAYGKWKSVPRTGFNILPDYFWCWSNVEANAINEWSSGLVRHKAVSGGNLFLRQWLESNDTSFAKIDQEIKALMDPGKAAILLTLSPGLDTEVVLGNILKAIAVTQQQYNWMIRLHPNMLGKKAEIAELLEKCGITQYEINSSSTLPLYAILRNVQLHVTYSSSTVIEAETFGVPSIIFSNYGAELFTEQLQNGNARLLIQTNDIVRNLDAAIQKEGYNQKLNTVPKISPVEFIEQILNSRKCRPQ